MVQEHNGRKINKSSSKTKQKYPTSEQDRRENSLPEKKKRRTKKTELDENISKRGRVDSTRKKKTASRNRNRKKPVSTSKKIGLFVLNTFYYVVTIGMILVAVIFGLSANSSSSVLGYRFYTVLTDSMVTPKNVHIKGPKGFASNDVIVVKDAKYKELKKGDIVTYRIGEEGNILLTHRLLSKIAPKGKDELPMIVTQGDANESRDPPVLEDRIVGKVVYSIPKVGYVLEFIRGNFWLCLIFVLSLFGSLLVLKNYFFTEVKGEL